MDLALQWQKQLEHASEFKLKKDIPYLAPTGELWGIYCKDLGEIDCVIMAPHCILIQIPLNFVPEGPMNYLESGNGLVPLSEAMWTQMPYVITRPPALDHNELKLWLCWPNSMTSWIIMTLISVRICLYDSLFGSVPKSRTNSIYHYTSNISSTLVGNKIFDHSDVVGASPVGTAATTSSFSTKHLAAMGKDNYKTRRETFVFCDLVCLH